MIYLLIVLVMGILSSIAMMFDSWIIYGWIHYLGDSIVIYFLINDYDKHECEDEDE